jgi:hypothetical protein
MFLCCYYFAHVHTDLLSASAFLSWHHFAYVHIDLLLVSVLYFNIIFRCFVYIRQCVSISFDIRLWLACERVVSEPGGRRECPALSVLIVRSHVVVVDAISGEHQDTRNCNLNKLLCITRYDNT